MGRRERMEWCRSIQELVNEIDGCIKAGYQLDTAQGRVFYFYHDCKRYWKYVRPVKKA